MQVKLSFHNPYPEDSYSGHVAFISAGLTILTFVDENYSPNCLKLHVRAWIHEDNAVLTTTGFRAKQERGRIK